MLDVLHLDDNRELYEDRWIPSRPSRGSILRRLLDAWAVLIGRAEAVRWPC
jgi:hypothetical protein